MINCKVRLRGFNSNQHGSAATLFAISAPVLFGFAALAVDVGLMYATEADLQQAADEVALAGLVNMREERQGHFVGYTEAQLKAEMVEFAHKNVPDLAGRNAIQPDDIVLGTWDFDARSLTPARSMIDVNAVSVSGEMTVERGNALRTFFGAIFTDYVDIRVNSIAVLPIPPEFHALSETAPSALSLANSDLDVVSIVVNSTANDALVTDSTIKAWPHVFSGFRIDVAGQIEVVGRSIGGSSKIHEDRPGIRDFLEHQPQPAVGGCHHRDYVPRPTGNRITLNPGTYCGLVIDTPVDEVIFRPGQYVFKDRPVVISNQSVVRAENTHFFFSGRGATLDVDNVGEFFVRARPDGEQQGVTIAADRQASRAPEYVNIVNSDFVSYGVIYLPKTDLAVTNSGFDGNCVIACVTAKTMRFHESYLNYYAGITSVNLATAGLNASDMTGVVNPIGLQTSYRPYVIEQ